MTTTCEFEFPCLLCQQGGSKARSLCSLVCKWNYEIGTDGREIGWNEDFLRLIGLEDLASGLNRLGKVAMR